MSRLGPAKSGQLYRAGRFTRLLHAYTPAMQLHTPACSTLASYFEQQATTVRFTPLLSILLVFLAWTPLHTEADGLAEASTIKTSSMLASLPDIQPQESTPGVAAKGVYRDERAESDGSAPVLEFSYYFVLSLGALGLLWIRRQSRAL